MPKMLAAPHAPGAALYEVRGEEEEGRRDGPGGRELFQRLFLQTLLQKLLHQTLPPSGPPDPVPSPWQALLVSLLKFLEPYLRVADLSEAVRCLYKGGLRLLLVLLHDFPGEEGGRGAAGATL